MRNLKILIIDDDVTTCSLLETILQMEDHQTVSANDVGVEGIIPLLDKENPQLLILDFHLRSKETIDYVVVIRANEKWNHLAILMTSAIDRRDDCLRAGANDFILKPFNWQQITNIVSKISEKLEVRN